MEKQITALKQELAITEALLKEANRVIDAIPECPVHGRCIPNALGWVRERKEALSGKELKDLVGEGDMNVVKEVYRSVLGCEAPQWFREGEMPSGIPGDGQ